MKCDNDTSSSSSVAALMADRPIVDSDRLKRKPRPRPGLSGLEALRLEQAAVDPSNVSAIADVLQPKRVYERLDVLKRTSSWLAT